MWDTNPSGCVPLHGSQIVHRRLPTLVSVVDVYGAREGRDDCRTHG